jgi:transcriptional regulator with XRE-family HTH domain
VNTTQLDQVIKAIASRIKQLRLSVNFTQKQVALEIGVSEGTVVNIESGKTISLRNVIAIASYFTIPLPDLMDLQKDLPSSSILLEQIKPYERLAPSTDHKERRHQLKFSIKQLIDTGFLDVERKVQEVNEQLNERFNIKYSSSAVSNALIHLYKEGRLTRRKEGGKNYLYKAVAFRKEY